MKILAIETATQACSVALLNNNNCQEKFKLAPRQQASLILPMIDALLSQAGLTIAQLDLLAFGQGPGSFTGVRIAASVIQGMAFATDLPIVGISTLHALAQGAFRVHGVHSVLTAIDARQQEVYWGAYCLDDTAHRMVKQISDCVMAPSQAKCPSMRTWYGVGDGWQVYRDALVNQVGPHVKAIYPEQYPHAQDIATLAKAEFKTGQVLSATQALPVYLRDQVTQT